MTERYALSHSVAHSDCRARFQMPKAHPEANAPLLKINPFGVASPAGEPVRALRESGYAEPTGFEIHVRAMLHFFKAISSLLSPVTANRREILGELLKRAGDPKAGSARQGTNLLPKLARVGWRGHPPAVARTTRALRRGRLAHDLSREWDAPATACKTGALVERWPGTDRILLVEG